jgi:hypothetical protein
VIIVFIQFYFDLFVLVHLSCLFSIANLDDWLTVHRSIILVDLQLDAQNSYLFTYNTFIKILQRVMIPEGAHIQLRRRPPEDEQGNARNI